MIPLEKELALTNLYLDIEQERFQDKLRVNIDFSKENLDCSVPSLILQPLVENAIKHGITDKEKIALIEIKAIKRNKKLHLSVEDNGPGFSEEQTTELQEGGIGLSNTKSRLEQLFGKDHEFIIGNSEKGGALVEIIIPCQKARNTEDEN
jgi:sensor histidine kinase YesM